jgi:hypothetical protein
MFDHGLVEKVFVTCGFARGRIENFFLDLRMDLESVADFSGELTLRLNVFQILEFLEIPLYLSMVLFQ